MVEELSEESRGLWTTKSSQEASQEGILSWTMTGGPLMADRDARQKRNVRRKMTKKKTKKLKRRKKKNKATIAKKQSPKERKQV